MSASRRRLRTSALFLRTFKGLSSNFSHENEYKKVTGIPTKSAQNAHESAQARRRARLRGHAALPKGVSA